MSTAAAIIDHDIPLPRYRIGETVFHASTVQTTGTHDCPDCLGTRHWKVITPAGAELEASCQRCGSHTLSDIPSLRFQTWAPSVSKLTIGSIRIDTNAGTCGGWNDEPVSYMCRETGVGGGSIYYESHLFSTEEEAQAAAQAKADAKKAEEAKKPERIEKKRLSYLQFKDAQLDIYKNGIWQSWYRYRDLREKLEGWREDENAKIEDIRWDLDWELGYDERHNTARQTFESIIQAIVKSEDADLKALVAELPFKPIAVKKRDADDLP